MHPPDKVGKMAEVLVWVRTALRCLISIVVTALLEMQLRVQHRFSSRWRYGLLEVTISGNNDRQSVEVFRFLVEDA